jgi:hypothetical protein
VDKAALRQVYYEYFGSPANHPTNFSIIIITQAGTIVLLVAAVPSGPNATPPPNYTNLKKRKIKTIYF